MKTRLVSFLHDWLPPVLLNLLRKIIRSKGTIRFEGNYSSWSDAARNASGYDTRQILENVLSATLKVKNGEAVFERDSVLFDEIQYSWPVTTGLMWAAAQNKGYLSVLDFGGSLGSSYFQNYGFFNKLPQVRWSIVEQKRFVQAGRDSIQDDHLVFYGSIEECLLSERLNVVLLSGVLQYLEDPKEIFSRLLEVGVDVVILDRTPFLKSGTKDIIKLQIVPSTINSASYPIRYFVFSDFEMLAEKYGYCIVTTFDAIDSLEQSAPWKGMLLVRNDH